MRVPNIAEHPCRILVVDDSGLSRNPASAVQAGLGKICGPIRFKAGDLCSTAGMLALRAPLRRAIGLLATSVEVTPERFRAGLAATIDAFFDATAKAS